MKNLSILLLVRSFLTTAAVLAASCSLPAAAATPALDDPVWERRDLAKGVELLHGSFDELFDAPQVIHILRVDLDEPSVKVRFAASNPEAARKAPVPDFVGRAGAIAATNGGYSGGGRGGRHSTNSGIFKIDGEVRPFQRGETDEFHFVGGAALGIDTEGEWHFRNRPGKRWPADWPEVEHALAGAHRLIEKGAAHASITRNATARERRHAARRHPRTAIGLRPDRTAVLITVDGRHPGNAEGMTLVELAEFLIGLGCVQALNLDGGGSTTMWLRDEGVINHPSDNGRFDRDGARRVFSAVVILSEDEDGAENRASER